MAHDDVTAPHASSPIRSSGSRSRHSSQDHGIVAAPKRTRHGAITRAWRFSVAACLAASLIFLIFVEIGSTHNAPVLRNIWFFRLNTRNVIPDSTPQSGLLNSIARTLGLHDFYQVGLWSFCQGYDHVTSCSKPRTLYWFNPVQIIVDELLSGASISLPSDLVDILDTIEKASKWMFGLYLSGACLTAVLVAIVLIPLSSRMAKAFVLVFTLLNAIVVTAASVIATVMFVIMRNVFLDHAELNIGAKLGVTMFVLIWFASGFSLLAAILQFGACCCGQRKLSPTDQLVLERDSFESVEELEKK